ncbi:MAG: STAS domain-containing protein [Dermatophilaceae bacterium]
MGGREELLVHSEDGPGGLNVVVSGRLDASSAADARLWMHEVIDSGSGPIWLDLGECTVGDSTALGLLLECMRRAHRQGRALHITHADARTRRLLHRVRLGRLLTAGARAGGAAGATSGVGTLTAATSV